MLRHAVNRHDVRQVDLGRGLVGQLDLGLLGGLLQSLESHRILPQVDAAIVLGELIGEPVYDLLVEVVTSKVSVTVG